MKTSNKAYIKKCILIFLIFCVMTSHTVICAEETAKVKEVMEDESVEKTEAPVETE